MDGKTILALAAASGAPALSADRADEIAEELAGMLEAAAPLVDRLTFEDEPANFVATLEALARQSAQGEGSGA